MKEDEDYISVSRIPGKHSSIEVREVTEVRFSHVQQLTQPGSRCDVFHFTRNRTDAKNPTLN